MLYHCFPQNGVHLNNNNHLMDFVGQKSVRSLARSCALVSLMRLQLHVCWVCILLKSWLRLEGLLLKWLTHITCKLVLVTGGGTAPPGSLHMAQVSITHGDWALQANVLRKNKRKEREGGSGGRERELSH